MKLAGKDIKDGDTVKIYVEGKYANEILNQVLDFIEELLHDPSALEYYNEAYTEKVDKLAEIIFPKWNTTQKIEKNVEKIIPLLVQALITRALK